MIYLKKFENHTQYETYINGGDAVLPNVSICITEGDVHYNPSTPPTPPTPITRDLVCTYVPESGDSMLFSSNNFADSIESMTIDGNEQSSIVSNYDFGDTNEHTVIFTLKDSVTNIGDYAFQDCSSLTSVTIPDSVINIGNGVFDNCFSLENCIIGDSVTSIGDNAFYYCYALTSIIIPDSVTSIGSNTFNGCSSLTSITIGNSVTTIGDQAFCCCEYLTSITIPNSVTSIGSYVFDSCYGLTSCTIGSGVTSIEHGAFNDCYALTSITCDSTIAPSIYDDTFSGVQTGGTLTVPNGSTGYDTWMSTDDYYLGCYNWTKVEQ